MERDAMDEIRSEECRWRLPDGASAFGRHWSPAAGHGGGIYLLHGLGEHCGRYDELARWLAARGWQVRAHDHHGHGCSPGTRGSLPRAAAFEEHASFLVDRLADELGRRPILLGHSMGGALAARLVLARNLPVEGLVLSSPALDPGLRLWQRALLRVLARRAPDLILGNGLDAGRISHDADVVRAYRDDPLVHDRISPRLVRWLLEAGSSAIAAADTMSVDTLLLVAGDDALVAPRGSRRLADRAPAGRLAMHWYEGLWHELFNERRADRARVFADLEAWLQGRA